LRASYFIQFQLLCPKRVVRTVQVSTSFSCTKRKQHPQSENIMKVHIFNYPILLKIC
jgi:hypothetical protein